MLQYTLSLLCVASLAQGLSLNGNTDLGHYTAAMIAAGDVCVGVVGSNTFTVTAKTCRSSCNYPNGVCVTEMDSRDIFATPTHRCQTASLPLPSN